MRCYRTKQQDDEVTFHCYKFKRVLDSEIIGLASRLTKLKKYAGFATRTLVFNSVGFMYKV
jgi:hypothetical protein